MNAPRAEGDLHTLLVLHTSDARGVVGVSQGDRVVAQKLEPHGQHAASLLGALDQVLRKAALPLEEIDAIVATLGPGSFTGIRIGLATAQGLAAARDGFVWACDSLLAEAAAAAPGSVAVVQDARRGEVYAALYDVVRGSEAGGVPGELVAPFCDEPAAAANRLIAAAPSHACAVLGSGASLVAETLGQPATLALRERPTAVALVEALAMLARQGGCRRLDASQLEPTYLRKSDAEIQRERNS